MGHDRARSADVYPCGFQLAICEAGWRPANASCLAVSLLLCVHALTHSDCSYTGLLLRFAALLRGTQKPRLTKHTHPEPHGRRPRQLAPSALVH